MEGSKSLTPQIAVKTLLLRVKDQAYYIGESAKSDPRLVEISAKIQASDDDDPILKDFVSDATSVVCNLLSRMLGETSYSNEGENITFTIKAAANTPDLQDQLVDYITNYMSTSILRNWLNTVKSDEAKRFDEKLIRLETELIQLSARRLKPERT
jgi:hypothetical protein|nr:MAG TPA: hypothetical protein [Bacteriophage sp.]